MSTPFNSEKIITHKINDAELSTFLVGFDIDDNGDSKYRIQPLINKLSDVIYEFAFGFHEGEETPNNEILSKLTEAAQSIYKIDAFQKVKLFDEQKNFIGIGESNDLFEILPKRVFS